MNKILGLLGSKLIRGSTILVFLIFGQTGNSQLIPAPTQLNKEQGEFIVDRDVALSFENQSLKELARYLQQHIEKLSGIQLPLNENRRENIVFNLY